MESRCVSLNTGLLGLLYGKKGIEIVGYWALVAALRNLKEL